MRITVTCPSCSKQTNTESQHIGKKAKCKCGHVFVIAAPSDENIVQAEIIAPDNTLGTDNLKPTAMPHISPPPEPERKGIWATMKEAVNEANAAAAKVARDYPVVYGGGPYDLKPKSQGTLTLNEQSIVFKSGILRRELFEIPYKSILAADVDTAERMTVMRVIALGIFAFGFKKKDKFLNLKFRDETDLEVSVVFGKAGMGPQMESLAGKIMTKRRESMAESTIGVKDELSKSDPNSGDDVSTQLEKLADLHQKKLITDEDYEKTKKQILSRL